MSEKPILFSTPMVQAILAGRKKMTRRVVKKKYSNTDIEQRGDSLIEVQNDTPPDVYNPETKMTTRHLKMCVPIDQPYRVGDILWVRETWLKADDGIYYRADETPNSEEMRLAYGYKWKPSIFMPRSAARLFLKVTNVRVERLQDITEEDAKTEGITSYWADPHKDTPPFIGAAKGLGEDLCLTRREAFHQLWDNLNAKRGFSWDLNPWVWVIEFERMEA